MDAEIGVEAAQRSCGRPCAASRAASLGVALIGATLSGVTLSGATLMGVTSMGVTLLGASCQIRTDSDDTGGGAGGGNGGNGGGSGGGIDVTADLVMESIQTSVTGLEAGESMAVSFQAKNEGPNAVPGFRVGVYLSLDDILDASDTLLSSWTTASLAAGTVFANGGSAQVPVTLTPGSYRLLAGCDDTNALNELDETNNVAALGNAIAVAEPSHPDFMVESVTFSPAAAQAGNTIDVSHQIRNVGVEPSGSFRLGVYLSTDPTINAADFLLGQRAIDGLGVGEGDTASGSVTVPIIIPAGTYYVGVLCDDLDVVVEMNETNNGLSATGTVAISAAPLPDLTPTGFMVQQSIVDAGQPIVISESVLNQGAGAAQLFQIGAYLSEDAEIDPDDDILLGTRSVPLLGVGASSESGPMSVVIPGSTPGGSYFVGMFVDSGAFVPELDETNNALLASGMVSVTVPPLPDLVLEAFQIPGSGVQVVADGTASLAVSYSVTNAGVAPSAPVEATLYFSSDAAVTNTDIPAGSVSIPGLDPGSGSGQNVGIVIPGGIENGSYRVGLWVDALEAQPELDEGNNVRVAPGLVDVVGGGPASPNLVSELIEPGQNIAEPGQQFQVVTRVANIGDLSTPAFRVAVVLSVDETIDASDTRIGSRLVPFGLGGGFTSVASAPVVIPAAIPDGLYRIGVLADDQDVVAESEETDNGLAATVMFEVRTPPPPSPNLVISDVSASPAGTLSPGSIFNVANEVSNSGDVDAGALRVGIYLSTDQSIDTADTLLQSRVLASLAAGASSSATTTVQIPSSLPLGTYYLGAIADDQGTVTEGDESDNARRAAGQFEIQ